MKKEFDASEKSELRKFCEGRPQGSYRTTCPSCSPTRRNSKAQCLSITIKADHVLYDCHHCEAHGATFLKEDAGFVPPKYEKPKYNAVKRLDVGLTEAAIDFLTERRISVKTAQAFALVSSRAYFPDLKRESEAIAFPYIVNGRDTGHKVRSVEEKAMVCTNALSSLFGLQNVDLTESEDLIICEGEFDPLAMYEAGILNATSVPNGSSSFTRTNENGDMREVMGFLWDAKDVIDKAKRVLIATDDDGPGDKLAEELARRIGRHRCWRVSYPDGCKDSNDVLMKYIDGKELLVKAVEEATPWPVEGLYEIDKYIPEVMELYENGFGDKIETGLAAVDQIFSVAPGLLTVVTGIPGNGKSTFVDQIMVNLARRYDYVSAICSFENPPAVHIGKLAAMLMQKHFFKTDTYGERMSVAEVNAVMPFIHRHFKFIHQDDGKKATIESVIDRIKTAVFRWGVQVVVVDPYNYIARPAKMDSETQWIDDMLTELRLLASLYGIHIFMVAHPTKMQMNGDGSYMIPKGYSISGSAAWFSKPDFGLTVHREQNGDVKIVNWKTRYDWLGKVGDVTVFYDNVRHCYNSDNWDQNTPYGQDD